MWNGKESVQIVYCNFAIKFCLEANRIEIFFPVMMQETWALHQQKPLMLIRDGEMCVCVCVCVGGGVQEFHI